MRIVTKHYEVYSFNELNHTAREKAINDAIMFYIECVPFENMSNDMQRAINEADDMKTPWFVGSYIFEYCKDEILEFCSDYDYLENGKIFN